MASAYPVIFIQHLHIFQPKHQRQTVNSQARYSHYKMSDTLYPLLYAMLSSYCLAGSLMEHFAVYPGWLALTSPQTLITMHTAQSPGITSIYVVPKLILTAFIIIQLFISPTMTAWFGLAMLSISWISSFTIQIPLQQRIRKNGDKEAVKKLIATDWVRVLAMSGNFAAVLFSVVA
jgi:hypothetical protein